MRVSTVRKGTGGCGGRKAGEKTGPEQLLQVYSLHFFALAALLLPSLLGHWLVLSSCSSNLRSGGDACWVRKLLSHHIMHAILCLLLKVSRTLCSQMKTCVLAVGSLKYFLYTVKSYWPLYMNKYCSKYVVSTHPCREHADLFKGTGDAGTGSIYTWCLSVTTQAWTAILFLTNKYLRLSPHEKQISSLLNYSAIGIFEKCKYNYLTLWNFMFSEYCANNMLTFKMVSL